MAYDISGLSEVDYFECEECGTECLPGDQLCAGCYLALAPVEGEA